MARKTKSQLAQEKVEYVNRFESAIDSSIKSEFDRSAHIMETLENSELSNDDIMEMEKSAEALVLRAERTALYKDVSLKDVEKLKALGIAGSVIAELANDSKSAKHVKHVFTAIANSDKTLLKGNQNVANFLVALMQAEDSENVSIEYLETFLNENGKNPDKRNNGVRHAKLFASVYARLGMVDKVFDGKRLDHITINTKSKIWKRLEKMFA